MTKLKFEESDNDDRNKRTEKKVSNATISVKPKTNKLDGQSIKTANGARLMKSRFGSKEKKEATKEK